MDHDKLMEEVERLQNLLAETDPKTEPDKYSLIFGLLKDLAKLGLDFDVACDKLLERQDELELKKEKMDKEFELKEKELELQHEIDLLKLKDTSEDAEKRRKIEKRQAWWELIKILASIGGSGLLILLTGKMEQTVILGQHKWSLIPKIIKG